VKITHNGKAYHYTLPDNMIYESGYSYNCTLKMKNSNTEVPEEGTKAPVFEEENW